MSNSFGLLTSDLSSITEIVSSEKEVEEVIIFGSRAKGNFRNGSDIDLALVGANISSSTVNHISSKLNEETKMPYRFDVLNFQKIRNSELVEHIKRVGKTLYKRDADLVSG
jgi:predicted nucleotidyltransferase